MARAPFQVHHLRSLSPNCLEDLGLAHPRHPPEDAEVWNLCKIRPSPSTVRLVSTGNFDDIEAGSLE